MEALVSSDESDTEIKNMKSQLSEFGFEDENLSKEEMSDLLKALNNSKTTLREDELLQQKVEDTDSNNTPKKTMKRHFLNVRDRRMPWSLFPNPLSPAEKARTLAVYIKLMSINSYRQARQSSNFAVWPPPIQIFEENSRIQPVRSTRSGRCVPIYADFDDDSSDADFVITKSKKRKVSNSEHINDGIYSNKVISLKRKPSKDENNRPIKEQKLTLDKCESSSSTNSVKAKKDFFSLIED